MLVVVLVLVLDTKRLKSFEDEHEDEDETANELIETALIWRSFFPDQTGYSQRTAKLNYKTSEQ